MPTTIIEQLPKGKRQITKDGSPILNIAELFCDTIQGENWTGVSSTFLRLQHCTLQCVWCDTLEVWRYGNPYSVYEILALFEQYNCIEKFRNGQHLILTGGSPLKQQKALVTLIKEFIKKFGFKPYIEIENEVVLQPSEDLIPLIDCWNNSPKLANSEMKERARYKVAVIKFTAELQNSWFKFVISREEDWEEIENCFLIPKLIKKEQIVLMPEGQTREELQKHYNIVVDTCIKHNVRMCDRMHVTIWNRKTGV